MQCFVFDFDDLQCIEFFFHDPDGRAVNNLGLFWHAKFQINDATKHQQQQQQCGRLNFPHHQKSL